MTYRVSVVVCTRNGEPFIEAQLRSILDQSVAPDEIVVSDDDSTDRTLEIVESMRHGSPIHWVVVENQPALGVTANFAQAVQKSSGDLIALCDQDDVWKPDRLREMIDIFEVNDDVVLAFSDAVLIDENGSDLGYSLFDALGVTEKDVSDVHRGDAFTLFVRRNIVTGATVMFKRSLLDFALPFPAEWVHDEWLAIIASTVGRVEVSTKKLIAYRQHASNQIGVRRRTFLRKIRRATQPRGDRNANLVERSRILRDRLLPAGNLVRAQHKDSAAMKYTVESYRAALPAPRWRRVVPVISAARKGWYATYASQGSFDIVRDLLQSH